MANFGIKIVKQGDKNIKKNLSLNSENILLKVHKKGAFKLRVVSGDGTLTVRYDDLGYRPIVLLYTQKYDAGGNLVDRYHFGDWRYDGAMQEGLQETKIYNDRFTYRYYDTDSDLPAFIDILGYYYIFKEESE